MQKTMKAAFVTEFGKRLTMNELPVPQPNDDQEINTVLERLRTGKVAGRIVRSSRRQFSKG